MSLESKLIFQSAPFSAIFFFAPERSVSTYFMPNFILKCLQHLPYDKISMCRPYIRRILIAYLLFI